MQFLLSGRPVVSCWHLGLENKFTRIRNSYFISKMTFVKSKNFIRRQTAVSESLQSDPGIA